MKRNLTSLLLLALLGMACAQARAQNQTPANVALVGWTDQDTGLTWTKEDNGSDVDWNQANAYCTNLRLGEYSDWRLPTIDELQGIYDANVINVGSGHVKGNLKLSSYIWSSTQTNAEKSAWGFTFFKGHRLPFRLNNSAYDHALCVRR
jgi:hypothetical protein